MYCTQLTDNTFVNFYHPDIQGGFATIEDALAYYLSSTIQKMDSAVGIVYAAAVVEEGTHLHVHTVLWTAKKITFDYVKKIIPGIHYEDAQKRLTINIDYLYKRNGFEDKGHTNRSQVIEYGELPLTEDTSVPGEWVNFINTGHTFVELIQAYPSALGRAYGLKAYINEMRGKRHDK